jgi:hypothetical protein
MSNLPKSDRATVAVVTGGHAFDVPAFHALFRGLASADCYVQHLEDYVSDAGKVRDEYDVVLFYTMPRGVPPEAGRGYEGRIRSVLEGLSRTDQGILVLHHALLTYGEWSFWSDLVGIRNRELGSFHIGTDVLVHIVDPDHPITRGMEPWDVTDETYVMDEPDAGSDFLLTVDHPHSMRAIGWTRTLGKARVFCLQSGHDNEAYTNPGFRKVLERGIQWCARRI